MRRVWFVFVCAMALGPWAASADAQSRPQPRIVAGSDVPIESHPYQARLEINLLFPVPGEYECGAVIRDATHLLTAAHCLTNDAVASRSAIDPGDVSVKFGSASKSSQQTASVSQVDVMPQYLDGDDTHDAGVLTLSTPLAGYGSPQVNGIPFAGPTDLNAAVNAGASAFVTGWGATSEMGSDSETLKGVSVPLRQDSACTDTYGSDYSPERELCAGGTGSAMSDNPDTCQGDSGGPIALPTGTGYKLAGLTSRGNGCGEPNTPAIYTDVNSAEICAFVGGGSACNVAPPPAANATGGDTTRPTATLSSLRCRHRRCTVKVKSADDSGSVASISILVSRHARSCKRVDGKRRCHTVTKKKRLRAKRTKTGFTATTKLKATRYKLTAIAKDPAGNKSKTLKKTFRVKP